MSYHAPSLLMSLLPFWALNLSVALLSIPGLESSLICVLKMNKGFMGLEQHKGEQLIIPLKSFNI